MQTESQNPEFRNNAESFHKWQYFYSLIQGPRPLIEKNWRNFNITFAIALAPFSVNVLSLRLRTLSLGLHEKASERAAIPSKLIPFCGIATSSRDPIN